MKEKTKREIRGIIASIIAIILIAGSTFCNMGEANMFAMAADNEAEGAEVTTPPGIEATTPPAIETSTPSAIEGATPQAIEAEPEPVFQVPSPGVVAYNPSDLTYENSVISNVTPSSIQYSMQSGSNVASVNKDTGVVTIIAVGTIVVNAHVIYGNHDPIDLNYTLTIDKAEQTNFKYAQDTYHVNYGLDSFTIKPNGIAGGAHVYYTLESYAFASIDGNGKLNFYSDNLGSVKLTAHCDETDLYKKAETSCIIERGRDSVPENPYQILGTYDTELNTGGNVEWYSGNVTIVPKTGYLISETGLLYSDWKTSIVLSNEGKNQKDFYLKSKANNAITSKISSKDIFIDKSKPKDVDIIYPASPLSGVMDVILRFNADILITVTATDDVSPIKQFIYTYQMFGVKYEKVIDASKITYSGNTATTSITVKNRFCSNIDVVAVDSAGNELSYMGDKTVVVDQTAPVIDVSYDNNDNVNGNYYNKKRFATIKIEEDNFNSKDVKIQQFSRKRSEEAFALNEINPIFVKSGSAHVASVPFAEDGEYRLDVSYVDECKNVAEPSTGDPFIIDTTKPELNVGFSESKNASNYFQKNVDTMMSITDDFFDLSNLTYQITAIDYSNKPYDLNELDLYIKDIKNWKNSGSTYTLTLPLKYEGKVALSFTYNDRANNSVEYKQDFNIDTQDPTDLLITYSKPYFTKVVADKCYQYYKDNIEVTISGKDVGGGIESMEYQLVEEGSNSAQTIVVDRKDITYSEDGTIATYKFDISSDFKGKVVFNVSDKAGNKWDTPYQDNIIVIRDTKAPSINVGFMDTESKDYYNSDRQAIITIEEANFDAGDVRVTVNTENTGNNGLAYSVGPFSSTGNKHSCKVDFVSDGEYVLVVSYTDKSGNSGSDYSSKKFCIDKKAPTISVSYDNNDVYNGNGFSVTRKATITVIEKNFDSSQFHMGVILKDKNGNTLDTSAIYQQFNMNHQWSDQGENHTISYEFSSEGEYEVNFSCNDRAGNSNAGVDFGNSVATNKFVIDKTRPTGSIIINQFGKRWNDLTQAHQYSLYSNKAVEVELKGDDGLSGVGDIGFYKSTKVLSEDQLKQITNWKIVTTDKIYLVDQEKLILYVRIRDKVNNTTYMSTEGMIIDYEAPSIEQTAPSIQVSPVKKSDTGIYNQDVGINVSVKDIVVGEDVYSGIKLVSYEVYNLGKMTQSGILYESQGSQANLEDIKKEWIKNNAIIVDSKKNNSNNVEVRVKAIDQSGNANTNSIMLKIDITKPEIQVSYDNNNQDGTFGTYFKENRTATITIRERNFDPQLVDISLANVDGTQLPKVSEWKKVVGSENLDDTTYTATIKFQENGHYKFDISMSDLAANVNQEVKYIKSICTNDFILDKTMPVIEMVFDNNSVQNASYYKANRTLKIVVKEHNFDASRVNFSMTLTKPDQSLQTINLGAWSSNGDTRTAIVTCSEDGYYQIHCDYTDMAGNKVLSPVESKYFIDKTKPDVTIEGVKHLSANAGKVAPIITYSDQNLDSQNVSIKLVGQRRGEIELLTSQTEIKNGKKIELKDFENIPGNDDYYELTVTLIDKAGNETVKQIEYSVNRFGSTYKLDETTEQINGSFRHDGEDIIISEVNVDPINDMAVILYKNNQTVELVKDVDFVVSQKYYSSNAYVYEYVISKNNFTDDGVYRIVIQSKDKAGNVSLSNTEEKNLEISFGVDKTNPIIIVTNLESGETYSLKQLLVNCSVTDNLKVETVTINLDGSEIAKFDKPSEEELEFTIPGDSTKAHKLEIIAKDAAGNTTTEEISEFYVTTNKWVQYRNNKVLFYGSIGGVGTVSAGTLAVHLLRKRKKLRIRSHS